MVCKSIDGCLKQLRHENNHDLSVGGSSERILNSRFYSASEIFCFDSDQYIAGYQPRLWMWMQKDFTLESRINRIIQQAFEGGLFVKWHRDNQRKPKRMTRDNQWKPFNLKQFSLPFVTIYGLGIIVSILSFFSEIFIQRKMMQKQRSKVWIYLERFFDGKRHYLANLTDRLERSRI